MTTPRAPKSAPKTAGKKPASAPRPAWRIHTPRFEADAVCPLMPVWPWGGHRGWSYDLIRFMKPAVIAELGVHWGTSLFAFAQAVKDARLKSKLIGVDTWRGDNHTGPYGNDVLDTVRTIAKEHFPKQSFDLKPMTFDEALPFVSDESINLLHIDGFHTYEAVAHDFETWLPKLAPDGVILLHDVAVETGYGSARFWLDLLKRFPGFAFQHSWGLGVVFPKGRRWLDALEKANLPDKVKLYTYRARLERAGIELKDTGDMAVSRLAAMDTMGKLIKDRDTEIALLKSIVSDRDNEISNLITQSGALLTDLDDARAVSDQNSARCGHLQIRITELEQILHHASEIAARVPGLEAEVVAQAKRAQGAEAELADHRRQIEALYARLRDLESAHAAVLAQLDQAQAQIAELTARRTQLEADVARLSDDRAMHLSRISDVENRHDVLAADIQALVARLHQDHEQAEDLRRQMREKELTMQQLKETIDRVNADLEMLALRIEQLERIEIERERKQDMDSQPHTGRLPRPEIAKARRVRR